MNFPDITTPDGRRTWAFAAITGGSMVNTLYLFALTYLLRDRADYLIWLAGGAYVVLIIGQTALGWAMGRRLVVSASRDGLNLDDKGAHE